MGAPEEICEYPTNGFVADFIGETNLLPGEVEDLDPTIHVSPSAGLTVDGGWIEDGLRVCDRAVASIRPEKI
ncbi:MAG: hypothetical protein BMS9Abin28_1081 [Anaerolineae bacterium]|nr:MAG: hypothetical protein BMS9Abin28_1081 [Anaerolineae bacterium]